jgi:hypothetical protein
MTGSITSWNSFNGKGSIAGDLPQNGSFVFRRERCLPRLQTVLAQKAIPPDSSIRVRFDPALGEPINIDLL